MKQYFRDIKHYKYKDDYTRANNKLEAIDIFENYYQTNIPHEEVERFDMYNFKCG